MRWGPQACAAASLAVLVSVSLGLFACRPDTAPQPLVTHLRLVAPAARVGISSSPPEMQLHRPGTRVWESADPERPTATIEDDTRPVLAAALAGPRSFERGVVADASGEIAVALPVGAFTQDAPFVAVVRVRDAATPTAASRALPARMLPAGTRTLSATLPVAARAAKSDVYVETWRPPSGDHTRYETAELSLLTSDDVGGSQTVEIEFAFGVLEAAAGATPVAFEIARCVASGCEVIFHETYAGESGWQDRRVSLGVPGAVPFRLVFETRWPSDTYSLPVWGDPRLLAAAPPGWQRPPDIVLLSIDTLRADHLPAYGYVRDTAPFLSGPLAEKGTVFESLVSAATTTGPSHMTMFTSLPPSVHRVAGSHGPMEIPIDTLASLLRDAGYETAAITDDGALDHERGFALGFDRYRENKDARAMETGQIEDTLARATRWLTSRGERPSFTFLHSFQVHEPYTPPARYGALFANDALSPAAGQPDRARWIRTLMADYDREIRYVDDALATFVAELEARGFFASGVLIVTSDHGEAFLEHGFQGHGGRPHEELVHAPLIIVGQGVAAGQRVAATVAHADLMPTLLELAGVPRRDGMIGRSLVPLLAGAGAAATAAGPDPILVTEAWGLQVGRAPALSAREGRYKLIMSTLTDTVVWELFDLETDPRERTNLVRADAPDAGPAASTAFARTKAVLETYATNAAAERRALAGGTADEAGEGDESLPMAPMDPDREAKLRALGYIE